MESVPPIWPVWPGRWSRWGAEEAGPLLLSEAVALASDVEDVAMVEEPVEDGGGDDGVADHLAPRGEARVRGQDHAACASRYERNVSLSWMALTACSSLVSDSWIAAGCKVQRFLALNLQGYLALANGPTSRLNPSGGRCGAAARPTYG
jgi:hypothetical protein